MCKRCCSFTPSTSPEVTPPFAVSLSSVCVCVCAAVCFGYQACMHVCACVYAAIPPFPPHALTHQQNQFVPLQMHIQPYTQILVRKCVCNYLFIHRETVARK